MKICQKSSRGITLVALVITIIILLILAGISINILIGDNGIISKVKSAREENAKSQALEELRLKVLQVQADKQGIATFQDIVDALNSDIENEYIISTKLSTITGIIPDLTNQSEFYVLYKNYWFKIDSFFNIIIISENKENIKEDTKIDLLPPPNFIPLISFTNNGTILISTDVDDSDENEENSKSGINYYEYYVSNRKIAQTKNSSFEIDVSYIEENTIIYIIAYDNANNYRESYHVNLSKTYSSLKKDYQNEIAFANNNNSSANLAFDNNLNTYWDGKNIDSYIGYDFYAPVECTNIKINQPYNTDVIRYFKIQYSDDNINYYDASDTLEYIKGNGEQLFTLYSNLGSHRFWRYKNISNYTNDSFCAISELRFLKMY